jgi:hypothetical protein
MAGRPDRVERFRFEWGGSVDWFHEHYKTARRRSVVLLEAHLRDTVLVGQRRQVIHDGKLCLAFRDDISPADRDLDPDTLELLYGVRDPYQRDELGRLVPLTILEPAPAHLSIRAAAALMPSLWGERKSIDVAIGGGVLVVDGRSTQPREVEQGPATMVAGEEHVQEQIEDHSESVEVEMAEAQSDDMDTTPLETDTPLEADLKRRLAELQARGPRNPMPQGHVQVGGRDDDEADDMPLAPAPPPRPVPQPERRMKVV